MKHKKAFNIYISFFITIVVTYAFLYIASCSFVLKTKENVSIEDAVDMQNKENCLFSSITHKNVFDYKYMLVKVKRPQILALGSSRVMQFRQEMFNKKFINAGGVMPSVYSGRIFLEQLIPVHKPDTIILGVDIWWFNPNFTQYKYDMPNSVNKTYNTTTAINTVIKYIFDKRIKLSEIIFPNHYKNKVININVIGYDAYKNGAGDMNDGYHFYGHTIFGKNHKFKDKKFRNTLHRIKTKTRRFQSGDKLDENALTELNKIIEICNKNNIKLILFLPPFAPTIYNVLSSEADNYKYVGMLRDYMNKNHIKYYDFTNPEALNTSNCEFIDGFHGGNVTYARIAQKIMPDDISDNLDEMIQSYRDHALIKFHPEYYSLNETDFLGLKCKK